MPTSRNFGGDPQGFECGSSDVVQVQVTCESFVQGAADIGIIRDRRTLSWVPSLTN